MKYFLFLSSAGLISVVCIFTSCVARQNQSQHQNEYFEYDKLKLEQAKHFEEQGLFETADEIYNDVKRRNLPHNPERSMEAEWRLSFTAENLGETLRALSHVMTVENYFEVHQNPMRDTLATARKALLLYRLGRLDEAEKVSAKSEEKLLKFLNSPDFRGSSAELAQIYFDLGYSRSPSPQSSEFVAALKAQSVSQKFLLRSLKYNQMDISKKAITMLDSNIRSLIDSIYNTRSEHGLDKIASQKQQVVLQKELSTQLLTVLGEGLALKPMADLEINGQEKEAYAIFQKQYDFLKEFLYSPHQDQPLTEESLKLNSLRRDFSNPKRKK